jgi:hypothetical protein
VSGLVSEGNLYLRGRRGWAKIAIAYEYEVYDSGEPLKSCSKCFGRKMHISWVVEKRSGGGVGHVLDHSPTFQYLNFWVLEGRILPTSHRAIIALQTATAEVSLPADRTILEILNPEHPSALPNPRTPPAMSASHKAFIHANFSVSQRYLSLGLSALRVGGRKAEQSLLTQLHLPLSKTFNLSSNSKDTSRLHGVKLLYIKVHVDTSKQA